MNRDLTVTNDDAAWLSTPYTEMADSRLAQPGFVLDLPTILRIVRDWKWYLLAAIGAGLALGLAATLLTTPMYRAWVMLQANPPAVQILNDESGNAAQSAIRAGDEVATQVGLLKSSALADRVAQDLNLGTNEKFVSSVGDLRTRQGAASEKIRKGLTVLPPQEGQLIQFSFTSDHPDLAARIANGVADAFINSNLERRYESSAYARNFLERQINKTRRDLERSERTLVAYAQAEGIINTGGGDNANRVASDASSPQGESLVQINRALVEATARRVAAEGAYRAAMTSGITTSESQSSQTLRQSRAALEAEYQQKRASLKPDHPEMLSLQLRIAELNRQIARENSSVASARINSLRADYAAAAAAERALKSQLANLRGQVLELRGRSIRYTILQRDVDTNRALYDALLQRYKEIGVAGGIGTAPVSIVDRAKVPTAPYKPNLVSNVMIGGAAGLLLGLILAVGGEYLTDTIKTRQDVRQKLGLAALGSIPKRAARDTFLEELRDPSSPVSESYAAVAASLRFATESGDPKVLLITSARASEGKSSSSLALAHNFARRGRTVLLVDCDLRKPAFKSPNQDRGLTSLLTSSDLVAAEIHSTGVENLFLLPSGPIPPNPADLLASPRFGAIIREASAQFDVLILDTPPVMGLADAVLIASVSRTVMLVVESGTTRTAIAREVISKLRSAGAQVVGATLTKSTEERTRYGYSYGYGYGYGYGREKGSKRPQIDVTTRIALSRDDA